MLTTTKNICQLCLLLLFPNNLRKSSCSPLLPATDQILRVVRNFVVHSVHVKFYFVVTSHHFIINNQFSNVTYNEAGTETGCAMKVLQGSVPNEHGTWLYGRDGWCDGQHVRPWVVDVTDQILEGQGINQATYFGWFNGTDPKAEDGATIVMNSWLVFYYKQ